MKKTIFCVFLALLMLTGCGNKGKSAESESGGKASHTDSADKNASDEKKSESNAESGSENKTDADKKEAGGGENSGDTAEITTEELTDLIEKSNDPDIDEETKREILDKIDGILKQAESAAQN